MTEYVCDVIEPPAIGSYRKIAFLEEVVRCRDCKFFDKDQVACDRWDTVFPCPSASDEGQGFCAWGTRKYD